MRRLDSVRKLDDVVLPEPRHVHNLELVLDHHEALALQADSHVAEELRTRDGSRSAQDMNADLSEYRPDVPPCESSRCLEKRAKPSSIQLHARSCSRYVCVASESIPRVITSALRNELQITLEQL